MTVIISESQSETLKRVSDIEGHLSETRRMLEEDRYCIDALKQTYEVRACRL